MRDPLDPRPPSEFLQAYVLTMDSGAVYLVRVMASTYERGRESASDVAATLDGGKVWDSCAFPVSAALVAFGSGSAQLRGPDKESGNA